MVQFDMIIALHYSNFLVIRRLLFIEKIKQNMKVFFLRVISYIVLKIIGNRFIRSLVLDRLKFKKLLEL